jgi:5-methylcytosine-specific restriction enzyme A
VFKGASAATHSAPLLFVMPLAAPKPCRICRCLVRDGSERCDAHKVREGTFADSRRGSRHERGYGTAWDKLRAETMKEQAGLCQPHLRRNEVVTGCRIVDHALAKEFGGTDDAANLQCICTECNAIKVTVEKLVARGVRANVDPVILASLTPPGVVIAPSARRRSGGRVGQKSASASARTDRLGEVCTPTKTTPPGVKPLRVR